MQSSFQDRVHAAKPEADLEVLQASRAVARRCMRRRIHRRDRRRPRRSPSLGAMSPVSDFFHPIEVLRKPCRIALNSLRRITETSRRSFGRFRPISEASSSTATPSFGEVGSCPATPRQGRIHGDDYSGMGLRLRGRRMTHTRSGELLRPHHCARRPRQVRFGTANKSRSLLWGFR